MRESAPYVHDTERMSYMFDGQIVQGVSALRKENDDNIDYDLI